MVQMQEDTGHLYNLEATPAEGTTYRFARKTASACRHPAGRPADKPYYTNSSQLPAGHTDDPFALQHQEPLQRATPAAPCCTCT
jgi:ribonucleoside-triphosphate reductase